MLNARSAFTVFDDCEAVSLATGLECKDPSLASQEGADETDINRIVQKWIATGIPPLRNGVEAMFGDFTDAADFRSSLERVRAAERSFASLPADLRQQFGEDPGRLLDFLGDESNRPQAEAWGLVNKRPVAVSDAPVASSPPVQPVVSAGA